MSFCHTIPTEYAPELLASTPSMADLTALFPLTQLNDWPDGRWLSELGHLDYEFIDQQVFDDSGLYYEEIIYERGQVPTRQCNWHDLFNALIWHLFPRTKRELNLQHMQDIHSAGLKPRTPRRDRITHFDECGVVLAYTDCDIPIQLAQHQWQSAFVEQRERWGKQVRAYIFGHANYEMLLNPYIGLTGKWLALEVDSSFWQQGLAQQYRQLDQQLELRLAQQNPFAEKGVLKPLPLLGVPGWWDDNRQPAFYANQDYFRPLRKF